MKSVVIFRLSNEIKGDIYIIQWNQWWNLDNPMKPKVKFRLSNEIKRWNLDHLMKSKEKFRLSNEIKCEI